MGQVCCKHSTESSKNRSDKGVENRSKNTLKTKSKDKYKRTSSKNTTDAGGLAMDSILELDTGKPDG